VSSFTHNLDAVFIGLDVHKDSISVGILNPGHDSPDVEKIFNDDESMRRLIGRFDDPSQLRVCYEAGPTGFDLARDLRRMGVSCEVIAPSMIPKAPGDKVKTDARDCRRLARLHRAGELVAVRVPAPIEEAVRDLCRTRGDMVEDLTRARHRLSKFLLRHSRIWRGGSNWTFKHEAWLAAQSFEEAALQTTFDHYRAVVVSRDAQLTAVEADLKLWVVKAPFAEPVRRLAAYRGVTALGALALQAEVCDWRRFGRAAQMMGFVGLVPTEYSSGGSTRRGHITKAGNIHLRTQLVESAWAYQHRPYVGTGIALRQQGLPPEVVARSWAAQMRLCGRFRHLAARKNNKSVVGAPGGPGLAGFLWAEMTSSP
jgi:transposase